MAGVTISCAVEAPCKRFLSQYQSRLRRHVTGSHMGADTEVQCPGVGPKSSEMLRAAGITSLSQLREVGAVGAYVLVKRAKCKPSLNFLWGLESAISGEHWRDVARKHRASLLLALEQAEREK